MDKKIISFSELKKARDDIEIPDSFKYSDILDYINEIEYFLNDLYTLAEKDEKYTTICSDEQFKVLSNVFEGFFNILFSIIEKEDGEIDTSTLYLFLCELYKVCYKMPDLDVVKAKTKILNFKDKNENKNEE